MIMMYEYCCFQQLCSPRGDLLQGPGGMQVECWSSEHAALAGISILGLAIWCVGLPLALFTRILMLRDRQDPNSYRTYGYFIQGLEPRFWYWDLAVKRADIGLMLLVAYTSLADDDKAKLLLFPLISGGLF